MGAHPAEAWTGGDSYERYVGRWSRLVAADFLDRLDLPAEQEWLDVGCGTGALSQADPRRVLGVDPSAGCVAHATTGTDDERATFRVGDGQALPVEDAEFDVVVSGLVLNFIPDRAVALAEMRRAARPGGLLAVYVWDYPGEMQLMRHLWDTAVELDPDAQPLHEAVRFDFCRSQPLRDMFTQAGLADVDVAPIVVPTRFRDFDDYWTPFLDGQAPAPAYVTSLPDSRRDALREAVRARLPTDDDGSIPLTARAWAVRGVNG